MSWNPFRPFTFGSRPMRTTKFCGASVLVAGVTTSSASAAPRSDLDFGRPRSQPEAERGLRSRFHRMYRRVSADSVPGSKAPQRAGDLAALAGGHPVSAAEADARLMNAALVHVLPRLKGIQDAGTLARAEAVVSGLLVLEQRCAFAAEHGISIERVLSALRDRCANMPMPQALVDAESLVRELNACLDPGDAREKPSRTALARTALLLVMPALCAQPWDMPNQTGLHKRMASHWTATNLAIQLAGLDAQFAGRPGYAFDRLFSVLCNHARILEFGRSEADLERALAGLGAMVAAVQEAIEPGWMAKYPAPLREGMRILCDGSALNALVGIDSEFDKAIVSLRNDLAGSDDAKEFVKQQFELAQARARMVRAFDRAGVPRPVEVLRGLKMDAALVAGMVNRLGSHAKDVGLVIMGVYLREQDIANSDFVQGMQGRISAAKEEAEARITENTPADAAARLFARRQFSADNNSTKENLRKAYREIDDGLGVPRDRELLRALQSRADALKDPGVIGPDLIDKLGLTGFDLEHVRQLERQGLSSAAEARTALAIVQKSLDVWRADHGPQRMRDEGLLDVLRTKRQEDRAGALSEALLAKHAAALKTVRSNPRGTRLAGDARRDIVRAAIAHLVPSERDLRKEPGIPGKTGMPVLASFSPSLDAVQGVLTSWGVREDMRPEIDEQIGERITTDTLAGWVQDAGLLDPASGTAVQFKASRKPVVLPQDDEAARRLAIRVAVRAAIVDHVSAALPGTKADLSVIRALLAQRGLGKDGEVNAIITEELSAPLTPAKLAEWALVDSLEKVEIGTRVKVNANERIKVSTGLFGDSLGVGVRAGVGRMTGVDFGNPGDPGGSFEVVMRAGVDARLGVDVSAPLLNISKQLGLRLGVVGAADVSGFRNSGVVLRCKTSKDQQAVTRKMLEAPKIGFDELADVENIMFLSEVQGSGEIGGGVQATLQPSDAGFSWDDVRRSQFMLGARLTAHKGGQYTRARTVNNNVSISRDEMVSFSRIAATATAGLKLKTTEGDQPNMTASMLEAGVSLDMIEKRRLRLARREDGKVFDAEAFDQSFVSGSSAVELVNKLGGPVFERAMQLLEGDHPDLSPEVAAMVQDVQSDITGLIRDIRANELSSIAWKLDPNAGLYPGNSAVEQSNAARDHRVHTGGIRQDKASAARLKKEADRIFEDRSRYNFARAAVIPTVDTQASRNYLLGMLENSKTTYAESLPVEIKLYAEELVKLAVRARREIQYGLVK